MNKILSASILLILLKSAFADSFLTLNTNNLPPQFQAFYDVHKKGLKMGEMDVKLIKNSDNVVYESITHSVGLAALFTDEEKMIDRAVLVPVDGRYRTLEFSHTVIGGKKNRDEKYKFDWNSNIASINYKGSDFFIKIPDNTFDNFSTQLLLMRKPEIVNSENSYPVISKGRLKNYTYKNEGKEFIETKLGKLTSYKFIRKKENEKKTTYIGWYAESLNYLPVRLDKYENGKLDLSIKIKAVKWK